MQTLLNLLAAIALLVWGTHIVRTGVLRVYGASLRQVTDIIGSSGEAGVSDALGPSQPGTVRVLRLREGNGTTRDVTLTKGSYDLAPVSSRYGARVIDDGGRKVGNRRADPAENQEAEAHDGGGQNHPVNGHGAGFVFQESGELGHFWFL